MGRFDILKYLKVIWDPTMVFVAKQEVIMSHWGSVGPNGASSVLSIDQWG